MCDWKEVILKKYKEKKKYFCWGRGFIGYYLAKYINEISNYEIALADNLSRGTMDEGLSCLLENNDITFIEADFTEKDSFHCLMTIMINYICWPPWLGLRIPNSSTRSH